MREPVRTLVWPHKPMPGLMDAGAWAALGIGGGADVGVAGVAGGTTTTAESLQKNLKKSLDSAT